MQQGGINNNKVDMNALFILSNYNRELPAKFLKGAVIKERENVQGSLKNTQMHSARDLSNVDVERTRRAAAVAAANIAILLNVQQNANNNINILS